MASCGLSLGLKKNYPTFAPPKQKWSVRLGVRTVDFHSTNRGSIPLRTTIKGFHSIVRAFFIFWRGTSCPTYPAARSVTRPSGKSPVSLWCRRRALMLRQQQCSTTFLTNISRFWAGAGPLYQGVSLLEYGIALHKRGFSIVPKPLLCRIQAIGSERQAGCSRPLPVAGGPPGLATFPVKR
jgi:hypothetical protein